MNPPQKLPLRNFNFFTLSIVLLAGLMIAALPQRAFAEDWRSPGAQRRAVEGTPRSGNSSGGGSIWDMFRSSGSSAAEQARLQRLTEAYNANEQGLAFYNKGDWANAVIYFQEAVNKDPTDQNSRYNLTKAKEALQSQRAEDAAAAEWRHAAAERQRVAEVAAAAARKKQEDFQRLRGMLKLDSFDGDTGGGLVLKGVEVDSDGGLARDSSGKLALKFGDDGDTAHSRVATPASGLALKFGDDDLQAQLTHASANSGAADSPAPHTDTSVVDLRDTTKTSVDPALLKGDSPAMPPEQLPKSIDDALLTAFADAPPGVSDRVRQGFQAIAEHDWTAALAAFQDALNKKPGDPGLKRLVDLAQFTLDYRMQPQTPEVGNNSSPRQTTPSSEQNSTIKSTSNAAAKAGNEGLAPIPAAVAARAEAARERYNKKSGEHDFLARIAVGQMAARARSDATFGQHTKEHGDHVDYPDRTKAQREASSGKGLSKEESDAQFQKALLDYYIEMDGYKPADNIGGSPAVDEIIIGGKG